MAGSPSETASAQLRWSKSSRKLACHKKKETPIGTPAPIAAQTKASGQGEGPGTRPISRAFIFSACFRSASFSMWSNSSLEFMCS